MYLNVCTSSDSRVRLRYWKVPSFAPTNMALRGAGGIHTRTERISPTTIETDQQYKGNAIAAVAVSVSVAVLQSYPNLVE